MCNFNNIINNIKKEKNIINLLKFIILLSPCYIVSLDIIWDNTKILLIFLYFELLLLFCIIPIYYIINL